MHSRSCVDNVDTSAYCPFIVESIGSADYILETTHRNSTRLAPPNPTVRSTVFLQLNPTHWNSTFTLSNVSSNPYLGEA